MSSHPTKKMAIGKQDNALKYVGIHLSGPNAHKTAVVVVSGNPVLAPLNILRVYEKIGSVGNLFSDERLVEILCYERPVAETFVDCPLTVPPCVACLRPVCPGVLSCEDAAVNYMLSLRDRVTSRKKRRRRPINPQSQRLWDLVHQAEGDTAEAHPTYSSNDSPLVVRAQTLQRRLNAIHPLIELKETSIPLMLRRLSPIIAYPTARISQYRNFEFGGICRKEVLQKLVSGGWVDSSALGELGIKVTHSVEAFNAFAASLSAALLGAGICSDPPSDYQSNQGWVYLPEFFVDWDQKGSDDSSNLHQRKGNSPTLRGGKCSGQDLQ